MSKQNFSEEDSISATAAQPPMSAEELLSLPVENILLRLQASPSGLSSEEAVRRLEVYGPNELARRKKRSGIFEFLMNFKNPLVIILFIAALISGFTQEYANMIIIFSIVFLSVFLDYYQESKAEKAGNTQGSSNYHRDRAPR